MNLFQTVNGRLVLTDRRSVSDFISKKRSLYIGKRVRKNPMIVRTIRMTFRKIPKIVGRKTKERKIPNRTKERDRYR